MLLQHKNILVNIINYYMNNSHSNVITINNKYTFDTIIGAGVFGSVYRGINNKTHEKVAIKLELKNPLCTIKNEARILKYLQEQKCYFIPTIHWFGIYQDFYTIIIPLYECNLYDYVQNQSTSIDYFCDIALKMLSIIEHIHSAFVLHRDIKPHHFMIRNNDIFLVDFGLSTFYVDENRRILPNTNNDSLIGSSNYASYFIHEGHHYSRRDDLVSIAYVLLFLNNRDLPWSFINDDITNYTDDTFNTTHIMHTKNREIAKLKSFPLLIKKIETSHTFIIDYITLCYKLEYYETPNYVAYISLFHC